MIESNTSILCEIFAPSSRQQKELIKIAQTCAIDLKVVIPLNVLARATDDKDRVSKITFSIPVGVALAYDSIWRLACRVAYFCPQTRVTTQIQSNQPFTSAHS